MVYECLFKDGVFLVAKPKGWAWSEKERSAHFEMRETEDLTPGEAEFVVDVGGTPIDASRIDSALIRRPMPWQK